MEYNDISIVPSDVYHHAAVIAKYGRVLEKYAYMMKHNMQVAHKDFDTVNYDRAEQAMRAVLSYLDNANSEFDRIRVYLDGIEGRANDYLNTKYRG